MLLVHTLMIAIGSMWLLVLGMFQKSGDAIGWIFRMALLAISAALIFLLTNDLQFTADALRYTK